MLEFLSSPHPLQRAIADSAETKTPAAGFYPAYSQTLSPAKAVEVWGIGPQPVQAKPQVMDQE